MIVIACVAKHMPSSGPEKVRMGVEAKGPPFLVAQSSATGVTVAAAPLKWSQDKATPWKRAQENF